MAARYVLTTLGPFPRLARAADGAECVRFSKQLAVLAFLTARPTAQVTRDELVGLFWTGSSQQDGRRALRQVVYQIRHATDRDFLRGDEKLSLRREDVEVDADVFRQKLASGDLDGALAVYERDFLAGVDLAGAREFEQWAEGVRALLAAERRQLLRTLIARESDAGRWSAAARYAEQLIAADPASRDTRLLHIELLALAGDALRAEAAAEATRVLAAETSGRRRSRDLEEAIARALGATAAPERRRANGFPRNPEMVGRTTQFHTVVERWKSALEGKGSAVLIAGEAGIGKTRLVRELARRFNQDRSLVVETACYAIEQTDPLGPFLELLRALSTAPGLAGATPTSLEILAALIPEVTERFRAAVRPRTPPIPSQAVASALLEAFGAIADEAPLALVMDDLHWASPATIEFAHRLARQAGGHPLLVVLSARDLSTLSDTTHALRSLAASGVVLEVALDPLDEGEVTNLLGSIAELTPEVSGCCLAERLVQHTDGIPLYILEALKELYDSDYLVVRDGRWVLSGARRSHAADLPLPASAGEVLKTRLARVGGTLLDVLVAMAVWGREVSLQILSQCSGCGPEAVEEALAALERRRLVGRRGGLPSIVHDQIAERVLEIAPADLVGQCHLRAARAAADLAARGQPSEWIVAATHAAWAGHADAATELAGHAAREAEQASGSDAGREILRRVLNAAPDGVRAEIERAVLPVLRGSWSLRRWFEERDGIAARRRLRIGALAAALVLLAGLGAARLLGAHGSPPLGEGYLAASWGDPRVGHDTVVTFRLDSGFAATLIPSASVAAAVREGFPARDVQPGTGVAVTTCTLPGVDPTALCIVTPGIPRPRPFFKYEGDAGPRGWLPDGADLVVAGGYLTPAGGYSYAILLVDSAGRLVRTIARDSFSYEVMAVAPDGGRILASRTLGGRQETVLINLDGAVLGGIEWCQEGGPSAWSPDGTLLACYRSGDRSLAVGPVAPGAAHAQVSIEAAPASAPVWSPDGRYVAIALPGERPGVYVTDAAVSRPLVRVWPFNTQSAALSWIPARATPHILRIRLLQDSITLAAGYRTKLEAVGLDGAGNRTSGLNGLQWYSLDPGVARVTGPGTVVVDRPGVARIVAAYGLSQADTARVLVLGAVPRRLLHETFDAGLDTSLWKPFGHPAPRVLRGLGRHASPGFNHNGDYSHTSGIALRRPLSLATGLTVEYWAKVPIRYSLWESVAIGLSSGPADSFRLGQGHPRPTGAYEVAQAVAPNPDAASAQMTAALYADAASSRAPLPPRLRDGAWHRYRLVIYPTGEVRWFADGEELVPSAQAHAEARRTWTLTIEGQSYRTLAMVDDVTIWEGVILDPANP